MIPIAILFLITLLFGQLAGIAVVPGVTVYIHDILLVILLAIAGINIAVKKFHRPALLTAIAGFTAISLFSLLLNASKFSTGEVLQSAMYAVRWLTYALLYVVVVQRMVPVDLWLWGLYGTGTGFALLGIIQYLLYPSLRNLSYLGWDPHYYRVFSTLLDPNFTGILLVFTLFLGAALWMMQKKTRWWLLIAQSVTMLALLLTYSRSSYVAFLVGVLVWIIMRKTWKLGVIGMVAFAFAVLLLPQHGLDVLRLTRLDSTMARIGNWKESLVIFGESPLVGHGFNTLRFLRDRRGQTIDRVIISKAGAGMDSSILFVGATTGFVGIGLYCWLWYKAVRLVRRLQNKKMSVLAEAYLVTLIALFVHSIFVNSAFYPWVMIWVWILVGVIESISGTSPSAPQSSGFPQRRRR